MRTYSLVFFITFCGFFSTTPANAQQKFFDDGEGGLSVAGTYKSISAFVDYSSSSGFGFIADWISTGTFGLGVEVIRREQGTDFRNVTYESSGPDITPFVSMQMLQDSPNFGADLVLSYTFARNLRKTYDMYYEDDIERELSGRSAMLVGDFYYKYDFTPSVQAIPLLRIGCQMVTREPVPMQEYDTKQTFTDLYLGTEISLYLNHKYFATASYSLFNRHESWENVFQCKAGMVLF